MVQASEQSPYALRTIYSRVPEPEGAWCLGGIRTCHAQRSSLNIWAATFHSPASFSVINEARDFFLSLKFFLPPPQENHIPVT